MTDLLITRLELAREALSTAIEKNYLDCVGYFDRQVEEIFQQILSIDPKDTVHKLHICEFLIGFCCEICWGRRLSQQAKGRLLELI